MTMFGCPTCGNFGFDNYALATLNGDLPLDERYRLSAMTRRAHENKQRLEITGDTVQQIASTTARDPSPFHVIDQLLLLIHRRAPIFKHQATIRRSDYTLLGLRSIDQLSLFIESAHSLLYLSSVHTDAEGWKCTLSLKGWQRLDELRKVGANSRQAFVAMSFDPTLDEAYERGIKPGLVDAGWDPYRVDKVESNEKICDLILAEIRRSALVVADYTLHKNGVYFEAGFGLGLGLPVIHCVREDELNKAHFDTRQYSHIVWTTPEDLREAVKNRVLATVPLPLPTLLPVEA